MILCGKEDLCALTSERYQCRNRRYVDDTLVLIKPKDIPFVLNKFNSFDKNLKFTVDNFENGKIHFLDFEISDSGINIFRKSTHTGQYTRFDSFEPWSRKTAWSGRFFTGL